MHHQARPKLPHSKESNVEDLIFITLDLLEMFYFLEMPKTLELLVCIRGS